MPSIALLAPVLLPLIAAGVITAFGLSGFNAGALAVSAGAKQSLEKQTRIGLRRDRLRR